MSGLVDPIEEYYEQHDVYRSFIVCDTEDTVIEVTKALRDKDHSVCRILDDDLDDERQHFATKVRGFNESMERIIVVSYFVWFQLSQLLQVHVLPYQSLVIFCNLDHNMSRVIANWLEESENTGFVERVNILSM